jgi:hypothetical protein
LLIAAPLGVAGLLNVLMVGDEYLHLRLGYIARYGFVFAGPWGRFVDIANITNRVSVQNEWLRGFISYAALLWIPAVLYSVCVWLLLAVLTIAARPLLNRFNPQTVQTLNRRATITSSIVVVAVAGWFAMKLSRDQIACNRRNEAFQLRVESIKHDANETLLVGAKTGDVSRFFAEHGIPFEVVESEAIGTLYTEGCGPLGCGTDRALIGVRVKLDSAGGVTEKPEVVGMYTDCL